MTIVIGGNKRNAVITMAISLGLVAFFSRISKGFAKPNNGRNSGRKYKAPMQLTKNFNLEDFLVSADASFRDALKKYELSESEMANLMSLVIEILEPIAEKFGKPFVTSGGRPNALRNAKGQTWFQYLTAQGFKPAKYSDHAIFAAADITYPDEETLKKVFEYALTLPKIRQIGIYKNNGKINRLHVAVITRERPAKASKLVYTVDE